jgi:hypothetical protein
LFFDNKKTFDKSVLEVSKLQEYSNVDEVRKDARISLTKDLREIDRIKDETWLNTAVQLKLYEARELIRSRSRMSVLAKRNLKHMRPKKIERWKKSKIEECAITFLAPLNTLSLP